MWGFDRATDALGTPTYVGRPRTLLTEVQCIKQGSRAIFANFGTPQLWQQVEIGVQSGESMGYRP